MDVTNFVRMDEYTRWKENFYLKDTHFGRVEERRRNLDNTLTEVPWLAGLLRYGILPSRQEVLRTENPYTFGNHMCRTIYTSIFSYPLITSEVVNEAAELLRSKRVLEVCAGGAYLSALLKARGIDVIATDDRSWTAELRKGNAKYGDAWQWESHSFMPVENLEATAAMKHYRDAFDVVFMSWPPLHSTVDHEVLKLALDMRKPILLQHEGKGNCTGSDEFYELARDTCDETFVIDAYVPFCGLHDYFSWFQPKS